MTLHLTLKSAPCRADDLECRLARLASGGTEAIDARLAELEDEWSAGRAAKGFLSVCILAGTVLTATVGGWWILMPVIAGLFLFEYLFTRTSVLVRAVHGLGFRTRPQIEQEKFALRTLRGDFRTLPTVFDIEDADDISRLEGEGGLVVEDDDRKVDSKEAVKEVLHAAKTDDKS
jgi:hypothetical protein